MYVGRMVAIGRTLQGTNAVMYRVSSKSFPDRKIVESSIPRGLAVVPKDFALTPSRNPYVFYTAIRTHLGEWSIAGNGNHVDFITEKVMQGTPMQEAIGSVLLALGYEKDEERTPRIVGAVPLIDTCGWIGIISEHDLIVRQIPLKEGRCSFLATYNREGIGRLPFTPTEERDIGGYLIRGEGFDRFEHPVTSAAAFRNGSGFQFSIFNPADPS